MFYPYSGSFNAEENTVCCRCGGAFRIKKIQSTAVETPVTAEAPCPKGRIWPPLLVLIVMFAVGLTLFFTIRPAAPGATDPAMPWFTVRDGELYFDESRYVGGPELTVPDAVMGQPITAVKMKITNRILAIPSSQSQNPFVHCLSSSRPTSSGSPMRAMVRSSASAAS